jgi:hypothetical protein
MRAVFWTLFLLGISVGSSASAQAIATFRSAVIVLVDDNAVRTALENDLVALARQHRYDAVAGHTLVADIDDLTDEEVFETLGAGGVQAVLMLRPASIGPGSSLESVRNAISPRIFANMNAFAESVGSTDRDALIAVIHMAIYTINTVGAELVSSGAVWLDEPVESREEGIRRLETLILANVDSVRPAIREHYGLPPLPEQ